jgi:putative peptidoglycan lipid II flippase
LSKNLKNIGVISALTVVSRVLGVMRDSLSSAVFGTSWLYSAFVTAFNLPNLFRRLLGEGALTAALVPTLQEELHHRGRPGAFQLLSQVFSWLLVVTGALVGLAMLLFSHSRYLSGHQEKWYVAADLTVLLFPYLALICLAAACSATLNVLGRFTEPALSPVFLNLSMIGSLGGAGLHFAHTPLGEMHWLCAGVLLGGCLQLAIPAGALLREGWRPVFALKLTPRVQEIALLMTPGLFGTAIYQINVFVSRLLAFSLNDSAATLLFNANRFMELPIGVFAIAISTVVYPLIARHAVERNFDAMGEDFRKGLRLVLIINVPAAVGLALLGPPVIRLIYQHGHFTASDAQAMATLLTLFVIGMPFFSLVNLTVRAFYAFKDTATPVKIAAIDFLINLTLIASTTAIIAQCLLLQRALKKRMPQMTFTPLWPSVGKVVLATAVMTALILVGRHFLGGLPFKQRLADLVAVLVLIPAGVAVYALCLWRLRIEGQKELAAVLARFRLTRAKP